MFLSRKKGRFNSAPLKSDGQHVGRKVLAPSDTDWDLGPIGGCGYYLYTFGRGDASLLGLRPGDRRVPGESLTVLNRLRARRVGHPVARAVAGRAALVVQTLLAGEALFGVSVGRDAVQVRADGAGQRRRQQLRVEDRKSVV